MVDSLCDQTREGDIAVAGLYCDYTIQQEQTVTNMMGAILKGLVLTRGISQDILEEFGREKLAIGSGGLQLMDLLRMLRTTIARRPQVFIYIDALDECLQMYLPELLESLRYIIRECPRTRIFLTGRPYIRDNIQTYFPKAIVKPITPKTEDIGNYIQMRLDRDDMPEAMDNDLRADIMRITLESVSETCVGTYMIHPTNDMYLPIIMHRFLLVVINIDAVLGEVTISQRREKLSELARGNGLGDAYTETLARVQARGGRSGLGMTALMWVLFSERPLRAEELCHALGVERGSLDPDLAGVPTLQTLLTCCLGLVVVEESSSTVRLMHRTLQEHLLSDPTLFHSPHSSIAEVCLTYLNFRCPWDSPSIPESAPPEMPLQEYASCYWGKHARRGMTENVKELALKLLNRQATQFGLQLLN